MSWLSLNSIQSKTAIKYDIINLIDPIYQDKTFTMKFIKKYPYGYFEEEDIWYSAEFYDTHNNLIFSANMSNIGGSNVIEDYIDLFNEYFYENIYDIFLDDELDIGKSIHELFNEI